VPLLQLAGGLIFVLVVAQLGLLVLSSVRRVLNEQHVQKLRLERLREQVAAAAFVRQEKAASAELWDGWRKFVVQRKVPEGSNVCSFYLAPFDRKPLPAFQPGQFLTFQLKIPGQPRPVIRCYSLSDCARPDAYRVTIKKVLPPPGKEGAPGLVSSYFHEQVQEGDILDVQAPRGQFVLDLTASTPVVFIAGGIGLTPLLAMLNALSVRSPARETWLFYGVRNGSEHIMKDYLRQLAREKPSIRVRVCYSQPGAEDVAGKDYDFGQQISVDLLRKVLPSNNYEFYVCGPPGMMAALDASLKSWGVPADKFFSEAFGPASLPKPAAAEPAAASAAPASGFKVVFSRSGKTVVWDGKYENLLNLARASSVDIPSGCCAGNCGTCETAVKAGTVKYLREPGWKAQGGTCLVCVAAPAGDVEFDA